MLKTDELQNVNKLERVEIILQEINIHTRITYEYLAKKLEVSADTIRRDINELAKANRVLKIKGGVMALAYHHNHTPNNQLYNFAEKRKIARKLVTLLERDMVLLLGGGTTISEFIKLIPSQLKLTVFTVNLFSAVELLNKPEIKTIFLGGQISPFSQMSIGATAVMELSKIKADLCIIGAVAIDPENGFTDSDWDTVEIKKAMISVSNKLAVLAISEKLNSEMKFKIADCQKIDFLVTEKEPTDEILVPFASKFPNLTFL